MVEEHLISQQLPFLLLKTTTKISDCAVFFDKKCRISPCLTQGLRPKSWVYAGKGNNFAKTMLKLAKTREELSVINDQFGAPTGAELLADCTAHAIRVAMNKPEVAGLYHLVASGTTTWHDYAALVFDEARKSGIELALAKLNAVPSSAYPTPAKRPANSRLNTEKFQHSFGLTLPSWEKGVRRMLEELFTTTSI